MVSLREIRKQIHSVANIEKITQAMEMVAASRLRKAQAKAEKSRPYAKKLKEILDNLTSVSEDFIHPLIQKREVKNIGVIVIAGDRGLCGGYNQAVFSKTEKFIKNYPTESVLLLPVGKKTNDYFRGKKWRIGPSLTDWGGKISYQEIEKFSQAAMDLFLNFQIDEVWLIYTHFISLASRNIIVTKLLNIENEKQDQEKKSLSYIFEPNPNEIYSKILPQYCITKIQSALNESYASELAARIFSMKAATKNAEEMIEKLTLVRNKIRQTSITREIIEITTCVENLK